MRFHAVLFLATAAVGQSAVLSGRWEGAAAIPGTDLRIVLDLAQAADGKWTGSAIFPGMGVKGAPLSDLTVTGVDIAFVIHGALGDPKFSGHLTESDQLAGDYTEAGNVAPFTLRRAGAAQVEPPRRGIAVRKEFEGEWRGEFDLFGSHLRAKLTLTNEAAGTVAKFVVGNKKDTELPVDFVTEDGDWLTLEAHSYGISYEGRFHGDSHDLTGAFIQGGIESPLSLHQVNP